MIEEKKSIIRIDGAKKGGCNNCGLYDISTCVDKIWIISILSIIIK